MWLSLWGLHHICPVFKQLTRCHKTAALLWWPADREMKVWVYLGGGRGKLKIVGFVHGIINYWLWSCQCMFNPSRRVTDHVAKFRLQLLMIFFPYSRWFHISGAFPFSFRWYCSSHANLSNILTRVQDEIVIKCLKTCHCSNRKNT